MSSTSVFHSWGLSQEVLKAIDAMGFENPTPVQEKVIPFLCANDRDVIVLAKTGTGKTAAFGIPLVEKLSSEPKLQALVLCPTRELAAQVAKALQSLGAPKRLSVTSILGGESYRRQIESLRRNPQIVVSTPGRLVDLLEQKLIDLSSVSHLVLDEADEMLSFGFQESLETIRGQFDAETLRTWLFSATMSFSVRKLSERLLKQPQSFTLANTESAPKISSYAAVVFEEDKVRALSLLLRNETDFYGIIFAQTKKQVSDLEQTLLGLGMRVESLHGDKPQVERNKVLDRIRRRQATVLVATDVAARGLDIQDLTHVVNFEIPWDVETYTHRIGRTARAGKTGIVWTLVRPKEAPTLRKFERALNFKFENLKIPTSKDVIASEVKRQLNELLSLEVSEKERTFYDNIIDECAGEKGLELNADAREWITRNLQQVTGHILKAAPQNEPRTFELRSDDRGVGGGAPRGRGGPDFRGERRFDDRGPRRFNNYSGGGERRYEDRGGNDNFRRDDRGNGGGFRRDDRSGGFAPRGEDRGGFKRDDRRGSGFRRDERSHEGGGFKRRAGPGADRRDRY
ncbi:MAG: DEAD/DEAH box helicase [Bdellovibrionaceae bacterium]|nr:DEAD/DEAH box helicase [Pseudobdellovibrionaceae bacterium]